MRVLDWNALSDPERVAALQRPVVPVQAGLREAVARMIAQVRAEGDATCAN
jgi:histidinol dehydrogenase